jgi:phosphoserine phosphatase RsbU/P
MTRLSPRRLALFLRRTSTFDRAGFVVVILYVVYKLFAHAGMILPLSRLVGLLFFITAVYFAARITPWVRNRLLWSVLNRLIVAYIFMSVVPILLLLTMIGFAAYLLELQIGAHLLRDDLDARIDTIATDTNAITAALSLEHGLKMDPATPQAGPAVNDEALTRPGVASVIAAAQRRWPELRVFLNHGQQLVRAEGGHQFAGLAEYAGRLYFCSAQSLPLPTGHATVILIAPITPDLLNSLPSALGPIQLTLLEPAEGSQPAPARAGGTNIILRFNQTLYSLRQTITSTSRTLGPPANFLDRRMPGWATFEALRADTGLEAVKRPVLASFYFRPWAVNRALLTSVGDIGTALVGAIELAGVVFVVLELAVLAAGFVLARTITRSIAELYDATLHVRRGDFGHRIRSLRNDQLGALGQSFNEMTGSISELVEEQRERQRLEHEVEIAREVQQQLFPHALPSVPGLDIAAICRPARVVSGDYYDFISLDPTRVAMVLADISGKGIFAALLMASLQAALRSMATFDGNRGTADIVSRVNRHLFKNTSDDRYATLFYAIYDSEAKTLTYTNAGHLPPFFISDGCVQQLGQGGTVAGLFEDPPYTQCTLQVKPGSLLVAFSDGLTEPENVYGEEFGTERLKAEVLRRRDAPAKVIAEDLISTVEQWAGSPEQADDMTLIVARMS